MVFTIQLGEGGRSQVLVRFKKHFIEIPQQRTLYITSKIVITVTQRLEPTQCLLLAEIYANTEIRSRPLQQSYCF